MLAPPPLKKGDKVGIVSPSGRIGKNSLDNATAMLEGWSLEVVAGKYVYAAYNQFGGTDRERAEDLQMMLDDKEIKAVFCSRGGYGMVRIIDMMDFSRFMSYPKWIVGYSDITLLHSHIQEVCRIETLHALMPAELAPDKPEPPSTRSVELLRATLFGTPPSYDLHIHPLSRAGKAEGIMTGGNLSVLYSLSGSSSAVNTRGTILFIEDVGEHLYHIDRMMHSFRRNGMLGGVSGLLVGGLTGMNDNAVPFGMSAGEIIAGAVADYDYPVCFGFPAGHQTENHPLILGRKASLEVGDRSCKLVYC